MSKDSPGSVNEVLQAIENSFHEKLKKSNNLFDQILSLSEQAKIQNQAKAKTLIYLCLALNPYRNKMMGSNPQLLTELGLTSKSQDPANLAALKELADILKNDAKSKNRRAILSYMADVLMRENWKDSHFKDTRTKMERVFNKEIKTILKETYSMSDDEIKSLADVCMNSATNERVEANSSKVNGPLLVVGLGIIGGYNGGTALVAALTGAGLIASATVGGAIVVGAVILSVAALSAIVYGIYRLCNLINNSEIVKDCKNQFSYFKAAINDDFAGTLQTFMDDPRPYSAGLSQFTLPELTK